MKTPKKDLIREYVKAIKCDCGNVRHEQCGYWEPKPRHTPTPWHIDYGSQPNQLDIINEADDKQICLSLHGDDPEDKANLELIVRAVNAHEELIAFLHESANLIAGIKIAGVNYPLVKRITEAIAKAEGKS